jgi:CheY-like chemotaxis protein
MRPAAITILAVDDDFEDLELMEDTLRQLEPGVSFNKLSNGAEVLPYLDRLTDAELPCLIILDYNMPEMTGAQVLSSLCELSRYESIPKVVLSTSDAPAYVKECMKNGATQYFVKPASMRDLNATMQKILSYCN